MHISKRADWQKIREWLMLHVLTPLLCLVLLLSPSIPAKISGVVVLGCYIVGELRLAYYSYKIKARERAKRDGQYVAQAQASLDQVERNKPAVQEAVRRSRELDAAHHDNDPEFRIPEDWLK